jgi:hypothetical protein
MYTKEQLKAWMDALFAGLEKNAYQAPWGLGPSFAASLTALQKQADDHFDAVYAQLQQDAVLTVDAFFNALSATFAGNPFAMLAIALAKQFVDAALAQRAAVAANLA